MDPLSDMLSLLKPRSYVSGGFYIPDQTAIQWPEHEGIKCYAVVAGKCWLSVDGVADAVPLTAGECYLLPPGAPFRLATDLSVPPVDFKTIKLERSTGQPLPPASDGCHLVGGHFVLTGGNADLSLSALPPIVHIRTEPDKETMRWALDRLVEEVGGAKPASALIAQQLAFMLLVQALRLYLSDGAPERVGWLFALADKQMSAAINLMHDDPARRWTIETLAKCVGMSRSILALRFKAVVGTTPIRYLTRWRMLLAADRLTSTTESVPTIAASLGYESESAFGKAFKRIMGCSPRQYSRGRHLQAHRPIQSEEKDERRPSELGRALDVSFS